MTEIDPSSERGNGGVWKSLMEKTTKIRDAIWGDEKIPEREEDGSE